MRTIIGLANVLASVASAALNFYFVSLGKDSNYVIQFLSHDDMDKGIVEPIDLTQNMSDYLPYEYLLHAFVFISSCLIS